MLFDSLKNPPSPPQEALQGKYYDLGTYTLLYLLLQAEIIKEIRNKNMQ